MRSCADIKRALNMKCAGLGIPSSGIFELTPRCNLRCKMCYVRLDPCQMAPLGRERTAGEWLDMARQCRDAGMVFLLLTGGEPTIRADFPQLFRELSAMGLSIAVNTNGTHLTEQIRQVWHECPPAQVNITLYGTCREDYQQLCADPDAFDRVMDALRWLRSEGILVHLNTTVVPTNYPQWTKIEDLALSLGLELRMTTYCFPPTRRDGTTFERLTPEQAGRLIVQDCHYQEGDVSILAKARDLDSKPLPRSCELDKGEPMQCLAGRSQFWITWNGTMTPCAMLTQPTVRPFEEGFAPAFEKLKTLCSQIRLCPECADCPEQASCMNCAAVTFSETGRFDGKPEYMCQLNRAYREELLALAQKLREDRH